MEHAVAAWSPWLERDVEELEKIQRRLVRSLSDVRGDEYEDKLRQAGLTTLKTRRERGDLIETFKALKGFYRVDRDEWFTRANQRTVRETRSSVTVEDGTTIHNTDILYKPPALHDIRNNFFTVRVVRPWNELPESVRNQKTVNSFKTALDGWLLAREQINQARQGEGANQPTGIR